MPSTVPHFHPHFTIARAMLRVFRIRPTIRLFSLSVGLACASSSPLSAQAPPDSVRIYAGGATVIGVNWWACKYSDNSNCYLNFSIYRNPPGFTGQPIGGATIDARQSEHSTSDYGVQPSTTYSYQVCAGGLANATRSNCAQSNTVTTPPRQPPQQGGNGQSPGGEVATSAYPPPQSFQGYTGGTTAVLKWKASDPPDYFIVLRSISSATIPLQVDSLGRNATVWTDPGPLTPHVSYSYWVCEGKPAANFSDCASSAPLTMWGANPVLTAVRSDQSTVKLTVAVDNLWTLTSLKITRQGSDDPCRAGTTMANGGQGCRTRSYGANGEPTNAPVNVTVYQNDGAFGSNSASAPWVIDIPDDHVQPGVDYFYQADATWMGSVGQQSEVATASARVLPKARFLGQAHAKTIEPAAVHGAVIARSTTARSSTHMAAAMARAKSLPNDAASLYAAGAAYCDRGVRDTCVSMMYMALRQAQKHRETSLAAQITARLSKEGVQIAH